MVSKDYCKPVGEKSPSWKVVGLNLVRTEDFLLKSDIQHNRRIPQALK